MHACWCFPRSKRVVSCQVYTACCFWPRRNVLWAALAKHGFICMSCFRRVLCADRDLGVLLCGTLASLPLRRPNHLTRMVQDLGIHLDGRESEDQSKFDADELNNRQYSFWSAFTWDKMISMYCGRVPMLQLSKYSPSQNFGKNYDPLDMPAHVCKR